VLRGCLALLASLPVVGSVLRGLVPTAPDLQIVVGVSAAAFERQDVLKEPIVTRPQATAAQAAGAALLQE
jgi:hypothetical protein